MKNHRTTHMILRSTAALAATTAAMFATHARADAASTVSGNTPWAVLMCKYADDASVPVTKTGLETAITQTGNNSMADYWRDNSNGAINLAGSIVDDWKPIGTKASYHTSGGNTVDRNKLMADCIAAHPNIVLSPTTRVLTYTNADNGHTSGGFQIANAAGGAVLEATGYSSLYLAGQEMGHAYGLGHAYGDNGVVYNDEYDVMGDNGVGLSSAEKFALGWISASKVATRDTGLPSYELSAPFHATQPGWAMMKLSDPADPSVYYTVEYRQRESWDLALPVDGVVIHQVRTDGTIVLQRAQPQPGIAALTANGSSWTSPSGGVYVKLACHSSTTGTATITISPTAYAQCGSGFTPPPANGGGGSGTPVEICTTCGPRKPPPRFT